MYIQWQGEWYEHDELTDNQIWGVIRSKEKYATRKDRQIDKLTGIPKLTKKQSERLEELKEGVNDMWEEIEELKKISNYE